MYNSTYISVKLAESCVNSVHKNTEHETCLEPVLRYTSFGAKNWTVTKLFVLWGVFVWVLFCLKKIKRHRERTFHNHINLFTPDTIQMNEKPYGTGSHTVNKVFCYDC